MQRGNAKWNTVPHKCLVPEALGLGGEADGSGHCLLGSSRKYRTSSRKPLGLLENKSWAGRGITLPAHLDSQSPDSKEAWATRS